MNLSLRRHILAVLLIAGLSTQVLSQGIRGEVSDMDGNPVPYAAIFIKELTRGTTCNALGKFSLPLPSGEYNLFFRSLGYTEVSKNISIGEEFLTLDIKLPPQSYFIPEVRISATGEDPAFWIMRKAIGLANYHLHEVSSYDAKIYIKGSAIIDKMPRAIARRIESNELQVREDEAYMMESMNKVKFSAPDKYEMTVLASQNTLPGYTENVNPMDYVNASLYQPQIENVITPFARTAFSYYRFSFEGTFMEGPHVVNKIRVIPKRKSQQLVEGTVFIVEDLWCIHSADLSVNTIAGRITLQQLFANVMVDAWLPVNHKIRVDVDIAGVKGKATYVSSLEYTSVNLNPNLPESYFGSQSQGGPTLQEGKEISRNQERINEILEKEDMSNRDVHKLSRLMEKETENANRDKLDESLDETGTRFTIAEDAVKNDSGYWSVVRPIPLTPKEQVNIVKRDSIRAMVREPVKNDSTAQAGKRKGRPLRSLALGNTWTMDRGALRLTYSGLFDLDGLGYNTVDGLSYEQMLRLDYRPDSLFVLRLRLNAGYAFHRRSPTLDWSSYILYAPKVRGKLALYLNYRSDDFNKLTGIPHQTNLVYTLFLRQNHLKLYQRTDATLYHRFDIFNGFEIVTELTAGKLDPLQNNSLFSFFYRNAPEERFTPNLPAGREPDATELQAQNQLLGHISLSYTPRQHYLIRNHRKVLTGSDWPTFTLSYRQAVPLENTGWSQFSSLEAGITHSFGVGLLSTLDWNFSAGYFPDTTSLHFSDYRHFKNSPLYVDMNGFEQSIMFSDYYQNSTRKPWLSFSAVLNSSYLLIKYLPWFSERLWRESLHLSYLHSENSPHYLQLGYSLDEIFFLADLGVFVGFGEIGPTGSGNWGFKGVSGRLNIRF